MKPGSEPDLAYRLCVLTSVLKHELDVEGTDLRRPGVKRRKLSKDPYKK